MQSKRTDRRRVTSPTSTPTLGNRLDQYWIRFALRRSLTSDSTHSLHPTSDARTHVTDMLVSLPRLLLLLQQLESLALKKTYTENCVLLAPDPLILFLYRVWVIQGERE